MMKLPSGSCLKAVSPPLPVVNLLLKWCKKVLKAVMMSASLLANPSMIKKKFANLTGEF